MGGRSNGRKEFASPLRSSRQPTPRSAPKSPLPTRGIAPAQQITPRRGGIGRESSQGGSRFRFVLARSRAANASRGDRRPRRASHPFLVMFSGATGARSRTP